MAAFELTIEREGKKERPNLDGDLGLVSLASTPDDEGEDGEEDGKGGDEAGGVEPRPGAVLLHGLVVVVVVVAVAGAGWEELAPGDGVARAGSVLEGSGEAGGGGLAGVVGGRGGAVVGEVTAGGGVVVWVVAVWGGGGAGPVEPLVLRLRGALDVVVRGGDGLGRVVSGRPRRRRSSVYAGRL